MHISFRLLLFVLNVIWSVSSRVYMFRLVIYLFHRRVSQGPDMRVRRQCNCM